MSSSGALGSNVAGLPKSPSSAPTPREFSATAIGRRTAPYVHVHVHVHVHVQQDPISTTPDHPYTRALLAAMPLADPVAQQERRSRNQVPVTRRHVSFSTGYGSSRLGHGTPIRSPVATSAVPSGRLISTARPGRGERNVTEVGGGVGGGPGAGVVGVQRAGPRDRRPARQPPPCASQQLNSCCQHRS
ncbi:hypothetical protein AB5J52_02490 [Streptomyces sp. R39]|uniref:Uncharacterized protein n=1 Tax=Streptomyces sp. R39 TaxID=3238631 RepID=A0AB39QFZ5_9ACTN